MRYIILLMLLMATMAQAQYYLPYQPDANSDTATITIRIGEEPTPPRGGGGGSSASNSYSYAYRSVVQAPTQQEKQTQLPTLPEMKPREQPAMPFQEYNPELPPGQTKTTIPAVFNTVPLWFILIAGIGQVILIAILMYLIKKTTE